MSHRDTGLELDDLGRLVASALHCDEQRVCPLVRLVGEKTGGNGIRGDGTRGLASAVAQMPSAS